MKVFDLNLFPAFATREGRIVAYSLHFSREKSKRNLEKIMKFHGIRGKIEENKKMEEELEKKIKNFLEGSERELVEFDPDIYRFGEVYAELLNIKRGRTITYGELAKRAKVSMWQLIQALAHNPFLILIPCHRVVPKSGGVGGYTPLGKEFKMKLLEIEKEGEFSQRGGGV